MDDRWSSDVGERLRKIFEHSHDAGFVLDPERDAIVDVNRAACRLLGYTREGLLGTNISAIHRDEMPKFVAFVSRVQQDGSGWTDELTCLTRSGELVPAEISAAAVELEGRPHIVAWVRDIRVRREAERALEESRSHLRALFEHSADSIFLVDPSSRRVLDVNEEACRSLGYTREELVGKHTNEFAGLEPEPGRFAPVSDETTTEMLSDALETGAPQSVEGLGRRKDGSLFPFDARVGLIRRDGRVLTLVTSRDVTERRDAERRLRASEERFRSLVENLTDAIYFVEQDGRIRDVNPQACRDTAYSREELLEFHVWEIAPGVTPERFNGTMVQMREAGEIVIGSYHRRKDGTLFPVEVRARPFEFKGRTGCLAVARDVSERLRVEEERRRMALEINYLQEELEVAHDYGDIIGSSPVMRALFRDIEQVAGTDSTVLLMGETGTGKELVARAIHGASPRKGRTLVKVNCAALSTGLIESELFGHERGAFTGAIERRIGRFELADGGTIFLDEIGDLPADLQAKLLRVLQEGEFERVGGKQTLKVDARVVAATNRDLQRAMEEGRFRDDLFYRLNVFPIHVPSLRERADDIRLLAAHFVLKCGRKLGKLGYEISRESMEALKGYHWPGNVRELENLIERAMIVSRSPRLELKDWLAKSTARSQSPASSNVFSSLNEVQRKHILSALERTRWQVSGEKGAAKLLGVKPSTLQARMKKLGIARERR